MLRTPVPGADVDAFDEHGDHLVVREDHTGEVVGVLPDAAAGAGRGRREAVLGDRFGESFLWTALFRREADTR